MNILNEIITKIIETPEIINQVKKSLVNRDLAIEIDGKRFQIMTKRDGDEVDNLKAEVKDLKSKLYDLDNTIKGLIDVIQRKVAGPELNQIIEHASRLTGN